MCLSLACPLTIPYLKALRELASKCLPVAQELLDALQRLKPKDPSKPTTKWSTFWLALQTVWNADDLRTLRETIERYRSEMIFRLLACINAKMDDSMAKDNSHRDLVVKDLAKEVVGILAFNHEAVLSRMNNVQTQFLDIHEAILTLRNGETIPITRRQRPSNVGQLPVLSPVPTSLMSIKAADDDQESRAAMKNFRGTIHTVLTSLWFRQLQDRLDDVKKSHPKTFRWVFSHQTSLDTIWSDFPLWLRQGSGCYWIQGKAGSGKSTLMKFILQHQQTRANLRAWAGDKQLLTSEFLFWYWGTSLQRSQEGLLRTLLHNILQRNPELISHVMPEPVQDSVEGRGHLQSPTLAELKRWFTKLQHDLTGPSSRYRVCLFIDGLDEYEGDHAELASFFLDLSSNNFLKIIVSSRPTTACASIFAQCPGLRLQDLTLDDVRVYAATRLESDTEFLNQEHVQALIDVIVDRSCGVFLWVFVVVNSLLEGLRDGDTVRELQDRVDDMPLELEDLYNHMLDRIPPKYRKQASEMLQLVMANLHGFHGLGYITPMPAIQLSFSLDAPDQAIESSHGLIPEEEAIKRVTQIELRLMSRCLGLLELRNPRASTSKSKRSSTATVELLHRTAIEFLMNPDATRKVQALARDASFRPLLSWFCSCISMTRFTGQDKALVAQTERASRDSRPWRELRNAMVLAQASEDSGIPIPSRFFDALDQAFVSLRTPLTFTGRQQGNHWIHLMIAESGDQIGLPQLMRKGNSAHLQLNVTPRGKQPTQRVAPGDDQGWVPYAVADTEFVQKLRDGTPASKFCFVALVFSLTSYLDQMDSNVLSPAVATTLMDFLVHRVFYLRFDDPKLDIFLSGRSVHHFNVLFSAGSNPNHISYPGYTIWTVFLALLSLRLAKLVQMNEEECLALGRVMKSFVAHGADLHVRFALGTKVFQPWQILDDIEMKLSQRSKGRQAATLQAVLQTMKGEIKDKAEQRDMEVHPLLRGHLANEIAVKKNNMEPVSTIPGARDNLSPSSEVLGSEASIVFSGSFRLSGIRTALNRLKGFHKTKLGKRYKP